VPEGQGHRIHPSAAYIRACSGSGSGSASFLAQYPSALAPSSTPFFFESSVPALPILTSSFSPPADDSYRPVSLVLPSSQLPSYPISPQPALRGLVQYQNSSARACWPRSRQCREGPECAVPSEQPYHIGPCAGASALSSLQPDSATTYLPTLRSAPQRTKPLNGHLTISFLYDHHHLLLPYPSRRCLMVATVTYRSQRERSRSPRRPRSRSPGRSARRRSYSPRSRSRSRDEHRRERRSRSPMSGAGAGAGGSGGSAYGGAPHRSVEERAAARQQMMENLRETSQQDRRVYVGNLSYDVKWHHLKDFMRSG
jgi:hypothetical protein